MIRRAVILWALALVMAVGCGGAAPPTSATPAAAQAEPPPTGTERLLAMLPQGAQVVVELDLARLRANPVVGAVMTRALAGGGGGGAGGDARAPAAAWLGAVLRGEAGAGEPAAAVPGAVPGAVIDSPLAAADQLVLAAYGVGTAQAAALTVVAARGELAGAARLADGVYALGPAEWVEQAQQRVALATTGEAAFAIHAAPELLALRAHAVPAGAPGASLRVTAQLSFDARIALARLTGIDTAPAQLSAWGDVVDDLAIVIDCDAADPGARSAGRRADPTARLAATLRAALAAVAEQPAIRALGLPASLAGVRLTAHGSWVRAVIAVGPDRLRRIVARAAGLLGAPVAPGEPGEPAPRPPTSSTPRGAPQGAPQATPRGDPPS